MQRTNEQRYEGTDPSQNPEGDEVVGAFVDVAVALVLIPYTLITMLVTMVYRAIRSRR
jgi:hypothetical protein